MADSWWWFDHLFRLGLGMGALWVWFTLGRLICLDLDDRESEDVATLVVPEPEVVPACEMSSWSGEVR